MEECQIFGASDYFWHFHSFVKCSGGLAAALRTSVSLEPGTPVKHYDSCNTDVTPLHDLAWRPMNSLDSRVSMSNCRGQLYDNAKNYGREITSVQAIIREKALEALCLLTKLAGRSNGAAGCI